MNEARERYEATNAIAQAQDRVGEVPIEEIRADIARETERLAGYREEHHRGLALDEPKIPIEAVKSETGLSDADRRVIADWNTGADMVEAETAPLQEGPQASPGPQPEDQVVHLVVAGAHLAQAAGAGLADCPQPHNLVVAVLGAVARTNASIAVNLRTGEVTIGRMDPPAQG